MDLIDIKIKRRPNIISGIKIQEGVSWLLIKYNPVDYVLDGYGLINKKFLQKTISVNKNDIKYKILELKAQHLCLDKYDLDDTLALFSFLKENKTFIQVELESDDYCLIGVVHKINEKSFVLNEISTKGKFIKLENIKYNTVRNIYLNNDYLKSYECYLRFEEVDRKKNRKESDF